MRRAKLVLLACLLGRGAALLAQADTDRGWMASGAYAGIRGQYRLPEPEYSIGYDGGWFTLVATGDRIDLPALTDMGGWGFVAGYASCWSRRDPALLAGASWSLARGSGDSSIGSLAYEDHEIGLTIEVLFPLRRGFALALQTGWDLEFFLVRGGLLPAGGSRGDLLVSSFIGLDGGLGLAYVAGRRLVLEAKAVFRGFSDNLASGEGLSESLGGELGRAEYSFELSAAWVI